VLNVVSLERKKCLLLFEKRFALNEVEVLIFEDLMNGLRPLIRFQLWIS